MDKIKLSLPAAILLAVGGLCFTAIVLWATEDTKQWLLGANGLVWTVVGIFVQSPLGKRLVGGEPKPAEPAPVEDKTPTDEAGGAS
jgi:hypothetical protein